MSASSTGTGAMTPSTLTTWPEALDLAWSTGRLFSGGGPGSCLRQPRSPRGLPRGHRSRRHLVGAQQVGGELLDEGRQASRLGEGKRRLGLVEGP